MGHLMVVAAVVLGVPALLVVGGLRSPRFDPRPELAWVRGSVTVAIAVAGLVLIYSLTTTWYISYGMGSTRVGDARYGLVQLIVLMALIAGVASVRGLYGHRNWSALPLSATWFFLLGAWIEAAFYMPMGAGPPPPQVERGLPVATWAIVAMSFLAVAAGGVRHHDRSGG